MAEEGQSPASAAAPADAAAAAPEGGETVAAEASAAPADAAAAAPEGGEAPAAQVENAPCLVGFEVSANSSSSGRTCRVSRFPPHAEL